MKWNISTDDAANFTQEFFTRLLEKEFLDSYDSDKDASVRSYAPVRTDCL
jgi:hypothetical protein